ncbi:MAG: ADP-heptose:LPS heptosyltransferase, partial [Verrucomicrobiales bacterium]
ERYIELARKAEKHLPVSFSLGEADEPLELALRKALPEADMIQEPELLDAARRIQTATHFLGNDTGITHLAAALGLNVTALFGPSDPSIWGPRGRGSVTILDQMADRSVDEVLAAVLA